MSGTTYARGLVVIVAGLMLSACATTRVPPPDDAIANAEQAIDRAQQAGAYEFAAFEFTKAQRKLDRARELVAEDGADADRDALRLARQAAADARLAEARARLASTRGTYQQMQQTIRALRQETGITNGQEGGVQ